MTGFIRNSNIAVYFVKAFESKYYKTRNAARCPQTGVNGAVDRSIPTDHNLEGGVCLDQTEIQCLFPLFICLFFDGSYFLAENLDKFNKRRRRKVEVTDMIACLYPLNNKVAHFRWYKYYNDTTVATESTFFTQFLYSNGWQLSPCT